MTTHRLRHVSVAAVTVSIGCVASLHILRSDLPAAEHRLSEYANGPFGWVMTLAFFSLAIALTAFAMATWGARDRAWGWVAPVGAGVAALAIVISGIFETGTSPAVEAIHSAASSTAVLALLAAAAAHVLGSQKDRGGARVLVAGAVALLAASPLLHETPVAGLGQRLLWLTLLAWLLLVSAEASPAVRPGNA